VGLGVGGEGGGGGVFFLSLYLLIRVGDILQYISKLPLYLSIHNIYLYISLSAVLTSGGH
jgi:hypothetical protein